MKDHDFEENMTALVDFLGEQQKILLDLISEGPEEFSPEAILPCSE